MLLINDPGYDPSRQRDVEKLKLKASDPNLTEKERKVAEEALYILKDQKSYGSIVKLREKLNAATQNGDKQKIDKLSEQSLKMDRDYKL